MKFKTNINCGNCVRAVSGMLNQEKRITRWAVDTEHPDKILTVEGGLSPDDVVQTVYQAGFDAEWLPEPQPAAQTSA
jgi:copper chaperone CopZ